MSTRPNLNPPHVEDSSLTAGNEGTVPGHSTSPVFELSDLVGHDYEESELLGQKEDGDDLARVIQEVGGF